MIMDVGLTVSKINKGQIMSTEIDYHHRFIVSYARRQQNHTDKTPKKHNYNSTYK